MRIVKVLTQLNSPDLALRPVLNLVPSGGLALGLEYDSPARTLWQTRARGIATMRRDWSAELSTGYRGDRVRLDAYGRMRHMSQLSFFGSGTHSDLNSRTNFLLRDPVVGGLGSVSVGPWLTIGGRIEQIWPEVGRGRSSTEPSIEERFGEAEAPGLTAQPRFRRSEASAEVHLPPAAGDALHQGARYRVTYAMFDDRQLNRFTFRRLDLEGQQRFAGLYPHQRLTLHAWVSTTGTDAGHDVPFYFQRTLGGRGALRSVQDDLIGSDGTHATLRGFRSMRFRDRHLLLFQAEYRIPLWSLVDATVFADAGKVTGHRGDLNLSALKHSRGFSLSVMRKAEAAARVDVGFGGGEGTKVLISFGRELLP
jgi:hypothetical protein